MVILHVIILALGGTLTHFLNLMEFYPNKTDTHIIINSRGNPVEPVVSEALKTLNNHHIVLKNFDHDCSEKEIESVFERAVCEEKPDVIHIGVPEIFLPLAFKTYKKTGIPFVNAWHHIPGEYKPSSQVITTFEYMKTYSIPQYTVSDYARAEFIKKTGYSKFATITNGIDFKRFKADREHRAALRAAYHIPKNALLLGSVGRIGLWHKRNDWLVKAIAHLHKKGLTHVYGMIVGSGEDEATVQKLAQQLNIESHIIITGWQKDTVPFYNAMDIFVHTSLNESFGQVYVEALACGIPVVTCAEGPENQPVPNAYGIVHQEVNGLISHLNDQQEFFAMLKQMVTDNVLRHKLAAAARDSVKNYDVRIMANKYHQAFVAAAACKTVPDLSRYEELEAKLWWGPLWNFISYHTDIWVHRCVKLYTLCAQKCTRLFGKPSKPATA